MKFATLVSCTQSTETRCWTTNSLTTSRRARLFRPQTFHTSRWLVLMLKPRCDEEEQALLLRRLRRALAAQPLAPEQLPHGSLLG